MEIAYIKNIISQLRDKTTDDEQKLSEFNKQVEKMNSKDSNLLKELEERMNIQEERNKMCMDVLIKIPRIEDSLVKLWETITQ